MNVIVHSLDGCLRLRAFKNGTTSVVEIRPPSFPGEWSYCLWRSLPNARALELFTNMARNHVDKNRFSEPVVRPGV